MTVDFFFEVFWLCTNLGYLGDLGRVPYGFADISDLSATQFKTLEDTCINFLKHKLQVQKAVKADISIMHCIY